MSTPTAVLSRMSASAENTAPTEGLSLAELLDVLDVPDDAGLPEGSWRALLSSRLSVAVRGTHGAGTS